MPLPFIDRFEADTADGKLMDASALVGSYIKSITPEGVATVQLANDTEDTVTVEVLTDADRHDINSIPGLLDKTADLLVEILSRTWGDVADIDLGAFASDDSGNLGPSQASALTYYTSRTPTASDTRNAYAYIRIPDDRDARDYRIRQDGSLGEFFITSWSHVGDTGNFKYYRSRHNLFEGYDVTIQYDSATATQTHYRGKIDQSDWDETDSDANAFILNKPDAGIVTRTEEVTNHTISGAPSLVTLTNDLMAGSILEFFIDSITNTYGIALTDIILGLDPQSTTPLNTSASIPIAVRSPNSSGLTDQSGFLTMLYVWRGDDANQIWLSNSRNLSVLTTVYQNRLGGRTGRQGQYIVRAYRNSAVVLTTAPTGGSVVVNTGVVIPPTGYTVDPTSPATGETLYEVRDTINPSQQSGTVTPSWSIPFASGSITVGSDNVQSDWNESDNTEDSYIQNKPTLAPTDAEENVQADWDETNNADDSYIQNTAQVKAQLADIPNLEAKTGDIIVHTTRTWANATDAEVTGFAGRPASLADITGESYSVSLTQGVAEDYIVVRIPLSNDLRDYRVNQTDTGYEHNWQHLELIDVDATYRYGGTFVHIIGGSTIRAQYSGEMIHTEYRGTIDQSDWDETDIASNSYIQNKPALSDDDPENVGETADPGDDEDLSHRDHAHALPTDNTLEFDATSGDLGVSVHDVIEHLQEHVEYFTGTPYDYSTGGGESEGQIYTTSAFQKTITRIRFRFVPVPGTRYEARIFQVHDDRRIHSLLGTSQFRTIDSAGSHHFDFVSSTNEVGIPIAGGTRIAIVLSRLGGGIVSGVHGTESSSSPSTSYDDADTDFVLQNSVVYDSENPPVDHSSHSHGDHNDIRGNIEIFYTLIYDHGTLVGEGKADTDLQNIDDDLTADEQALVRERIDAVSHVGGSRTSDRVLHVTYTINDGIGAVDTVVNRSYLGNIYRVRARDIALGFRMRIRVNPAFQSNYEMLYYPITQFSDTDYRPEGTIVTLGALTTNIVAANTEVELEFAFPGANMTEITEDAEGDSYFAFVLHETVGLGRATSGFLATGAVETTTSVVGFDFIGSAASIAAPSSSENLFLSAALATSMDIDFQIAIDDAFDVEQDGSHVISVPSALDFRGPVEVEEVDAGKARITILRNPVAYWWSLNATERVPDTFPYIGAEGDFRRRLQFSSNDPTEEFFGDGRIGNIFVSGINVSSDIDAGPTPGATSDQVVFQLPAGLWSIEVWIESNVSLDASTFLRLNQITSGIDDRRVSSSAIYGGTDSAQGGNPIVISSGFLRATELETTGNEEFYFVVTGIDSVRAFRYYLRIERLD